MYWTLFYQNKSCLFVHILILPKLLFDYFFLQPYGFPYASQPSYPPYSGSNPGYGAPPPGYQSYRNIEDSPSHPRASVQDPRYGREERTREGRDRSDSKSRMVESGNCIHILFFYLNFLNVFFLFFHKSKYKLLTKKISIWFETKYYCRYLVNMYFK